jgi:hypothetical protein
MWHAAAILDRARALHPDASKWTSAHLSKHNVGDSHNNLLETLALLFAVLRYSKQLYRRRLRVRGDNVAALAALRRGHSPTSPHLAALGLKIRLALLALETELVSATHLPGTLNTTADRASRKWIREHQRLEWPLDPHTLGNMLHDLRTVLPEVDAFATAANTKCRRFWSLYPDPLADATDAMAQTWTARSLLLNPPFAMMMRVINKLEVERPAHAVVVAPHWPNQAWHRRLMSMTERHLLAPTTAVMAGPNATEALLNPKWRIAVHLLRAPPGSTTRSPESRPTWQRPHLPPPSTAPRSPVPTPRHHNHLPPSPGTPRR